METAKATEPGILSGLGIKSIHPDLTGTGILPAAYCGLLSTNLISTENGWQIFKEKHSLVSLWKLFQHIKVISFCEWASFAYGTDIWDGLLSEVIRPIAAKNRMFIFQLGDVRSKKFFEVNEILDIISDFSMHGRVSLVLDEQEACYLSALLHGKNITLKEGLKTNQQTDFRYGAIFQLMHIDQLLISTSNAILVHQADKQFELPGSAAGKDAAIQVATHL